MLKWILAAIAALFVTAATRAQNVTNIGPSAWSGLTTATAYNGAALGLPTGGALYSPTSATFTTWAAAGETEPTGGQYVAKGASTGFITLVNNQILAPCGESEGTVFGGTAGTTYSGYASVSFDVMFKVADIGAVASTNDDTIAELQLGASAAYRIQFRVVNHTGVNFKQRCGVKMYAVPTTTVQKVTGYANANTLEPEMEFNKVYTVTLQVGAATGTAGWYRIFLDKTLHSHKTGIDTDAGLGAFGNRIWLVSLVASSNIELRVLPRIMVGNDSAWYTSLANPTPASNVGTTRVFQTAFTPMATETTGYPFTITNLVGTPVITATSYGLTAATLGRNRFVFSSASAADSVRLSSVDPIGDLESDSAGNQFVGWTSEYIPTGSAVWGIREGGDTTSYAVSVNYSNGILREGSTAGSGTVLFTLDPLKVYGIAISGNVIDGSARVFAFNLSDDFRRVPLVRWANLTAAWPKGSKGVMSAVYVFGATMPEASTMIAGRTFGLMVGDSYNSTYCNTRGTAVLNITAATGTTTGTLTETATGATLTSTTTTVVGGVGNVVGTNASPYLLGGGAVTYAGGGTATGGAIEFRNTIICTNNNLGFHVAHGAENHYIPNAYRPGKPVSTSIPDVTYQWSIGRSGLRIEDMGSTIDACSGLRGATVLVLGGFFHNSMTGITAATSATMLSEWGVKARTLRDNCLMGGNTVIWPGGVINTSLYAGAGVSAGNFSLTGAEAFASGVYAEIAKGVPSEGTFYSINLYPESNACFVGATDNIHLSGNTEGGRYYVSRMFGNVPGGFSSGALRMRN